MNICIYGASSTELDPVFSEQAYLLGEKLAKRGHTMIFGAGAHGVMGALARGVAAGEGKMVGVCPEFLNFGGNLYPGITELVITETMRERKQKMEDSAEAFIMAPGGIGTLEEFFEILTLKQLGRHRKPIAVFNTDGYYDELLAFLENAINRRFVKENCRELYFVSADPDEVLDYLENYDPGEIVDFKHYGLLKP